MQTVKPLDISAIDIIPRPTQGKTALPRTTDEVWTFPADTHQVLFVCAAITKMNMIMTTMTTMRFGSYLTLPGDTQSTPRLCHHNEDELDDDFDDHDEAWILAVDTHNALFVRLRCLSVVRVHARR